ncbi:Mth938-like domain-containing protein [Thalassobaculum sp.]|uniref:Mth938-like domain-containing protein n=1 Tax=Thalassobaculum sp. TaxID=2022740 RepID=UPI003B5C49ED
MVDITPMVAQGVQIIHGYGDGKFRIGEVSHTGPVIVRPENTQPWDVDIEAALAELNLDSLGPVLEAENRFDILLIGTGTKQVFLPPAKRRQIREKGPVAEVMDTGAACRTFNLLLAEGRRVAAALLPVE